MNHNKNSEQLAEKKALLRSELPRGTIPSKLYIKQNKKIFLNTKKPKQLLDMSCQTLIKLFFIYE
ncbi:hypothetical protein BpHYR1_028390 [Brachionus plicatilis]|uniref:Uncharacterized protein n=1 Tax=Brachionus plicatilis TaxID=10195 RepID=A0A3M7RN87_BRAPC|nr:hypothetical protein BpHYR1_028390 [Brachionus plicatilis]